MRFVRYGFCGIDSATMIKITVQQAAKKRGIKKAHHLQIEFGFSPAVAADLWRGTNGHDSPLPRLQTLNTICEKWKCPLDELVRWMPDSRQRKA